MSRLLALTLTLVLGCHVVAPTSPAGADGDADVGFAYLNDLRRSCGLDPVVLDPEMSYAATLHAHYLTTNAGRPELAGLLAHHEDLELPGASREGAIAGENSVIAYDNATAGGAIDEWLATFYHRIPLLRRDLQKIGIGHSGLVHVLAVELRPIAHQPAVLYPFDHQRDVPALYAVSEIPEPRPRSWWGSGWADAVVMRSGYPITITFDPTATITDVRAQLTGPASTLEVAVSSPPSPATNFPQGNVIALLPRRALTPDARYHASIACAVDGIPTRFDWTFSTAPPRPYNVATEPPPPAGTPIRVVGIVASVSPTSFCNDHEMKRCQEHINVTLATRTLKDRRIVLDMYNLGPDREKVLGLVGRQIEATGFAGGSSPFQVTLPLDGLGSLVVAAIGQ